MTGGGVRCQLLTRSTRAALIGSSAPFSVVLSGSLTGRLGREVAGAARVFLPANGGDDWAPPLRHKLIREEEVVGRAVLCHH